MVSRHRLCGYLSHILAHLNTKTYTYYKTEKADENKLVENKNKTGIWTMTAYWILFILQWDMAYTRAKILAESFYQHQYKHHFRSRYE